MFEKEAKKWVKENTRIEYSASFGEFPIAPSATKSFTAGAEFGYNKANEWHYVKDELPIITEKGRWLNLILKDRRVETFWWNFKSVPQRVIDNFRADVIAWKEIVLPELTKEMKENADISIEKRMVRENQEWRKDD